VDDNVETFRNQVEISRKIAVRPAEQAKRTCGNEKKCVWDGKRIDEERMA
jgi:hypothetical protein